MNEPTPTPYDWLQQVPSSLLEWDTIPIQGAAPSFPWQTFSEIFSQSTKLEGFELKFNELEWRAPDALFSKIPKPATIPFAIAEIGEPAILAISSDHLDAAIAALITGSADAPFSLEPEIRDGFRQFLALEAIHAIQQCDFDSTLSIHLLDTTPAIDSQALCIDLDIQLGARRFHACLAIPNNFQKKWVEHYSQRSKPYSQRTLAKQLELTLHIEIGNSTLTPSNWKLLQIGDLLILDRCSVDPGEKRQGRATLTALGRPLFRGKFSGDQIKILELPQLHEVNTVIDDTSEDDSSFDDDFDIEEEDLLNDEEDSMSEDETSIDENVMDDSLDQENESEEPQKPEEAPSQHPSSHRPQELVDSGEIPMVIAVEVGRLQMPIQKLMELEPGNLIELPVGPEDGVDLIVNGKLIARGELLKIGNVLGVRILEKK